MTTDCPHCQYSLKVKEEWLGRKVKCPGCKEPFRIPEVIEASKSKPKAVKQTKASSGVKKAKSSSKVSPSAAKPSAKKVSKSSARPTTAKTSGKKVSGAKATSSAKGGPTVRKKTRPPVNHGSPYKSLFNTIAIIGICAPFIIFHHNETQAARVAEQEALIAQQEHAEKEIARIEQEKIEMKRNALAEARKNAKEAKAELSDEIAEELKAKEEQLIADGFKDMLAHYIAVEEKIVEERRAELESIQKVIAAKVMSEKKLDVGQMQQAKDPFFKDNVIGIFMNRCHKCHGNEEAKGGLRMHTRDFMTRGGDSGASIIAGDSAKSLLIELITLDEDDDDIMPPKGGKLSEKEIAAIIKWIDDGAHW